MNTPIIILFLASAVAYSYAAVAIYRAEPKPTEFADQEGCYLSSLNRVLPYETPYFPDNEQCEQYTCNRNNETQLFTCGAVAVSPNCQATYNKQLKYPDCCKPTIVCDQTTVAPTTEAATTTTAATTTNAPSTTSAPPTPPPQGSSASAYASSQSGSPPVAQASATPGASAAAQAS